MNIHTLTKETHPTAGYENVYMQEHLPEEYAECFTDAERAALNAGKTIERDVRGGWKVRIVRADILALQALGRTK